MRHLGFLRSTGLARTLCLLIALEAVAGTLLPAGKAAELVSERLGGGALAAARFVGLVETYASPLFLGMLALLALNVLFCTGSRLAPGLRSPSRRRWPALLDATMHLSLVVLLAGGAVKGARGSVGTQYLFPGAVATTFNRGGDGPEVPLGFGLLLKEIVREHHPLLARVGVRSAATGERIALVTLREGRAERVPAADLRLRLTADELDAGWLGIRADGGGRSGELRLATAPGGPTGGVFGGARIELVAWRRDLKGVRGRIALIEGGAQLREELLGVNEPIAHRGASVFLSAWGEDEFGNPHLGIQVSRDPGAPLFWIGALMLAVSMPLYLLLRAGRPAAPPRARPAAE